MVSYQDSTVDVAAGGVAFTFDWYERFLRELRARGYTCKGYDDPLGPGDLILRHDVDLSPKKALQMAQIEADLGMHAMYFFMISSPLYNVFHDTQRAVLADLHKYGHDVGLHFSTHQYWRDPPSTRDLVSRVQEEQDALRICLDELSDAVTFHCPPDWVLGREFEGFTSGYAERFFTDIAYRGDSQQRWRRSHPFSDGYPETIHLLVHPGLWGERDLEYDRCVADAINHHSARTERIVREELVEERFDPTVYRYTADTTDR